MSLRKNTVLEPDILNFYDILNRAGFGKTQIWALLTSGFLVMLVFTELMGMAIIGPASQCDLEMNDLKKSILYGSGFLGIILASFYWGVLSDIKGRKWVLMRSTCIGNVLSIASSCMPNYITFLIMRFMVGLFIAGASFTAITYLAEFCPYRHRRIIINYMAMFNGIGMLYCPGLADMLLCCDWIYNLGFVQYRPWRLLMLLYTLPGILGILLLWKLPESPEFLYSHHDKAEVYEVLQWIHHLNTGEIIEIRNIPKIQRPEGGTSSSRRGKLVHMLHLESLPTFEKTFILPFSLACFVLFTLFLVGNGLGIWFTDLRNRLVYTGENDTNISKTICGDISLSMDQDIELDQFVCIDIARTYRDSILLGIGFILIYNIIGLLLRWVKRQYIVMALLIICGCCGIGLVLFTHKIAIVTTFILFLAIPNVAINLVISTIMDFTSTRVRGKIVGISYLLGRIGVIIGSVLVGTTINNYCALTFVIFTVFIFISSAVVCYLSQQHI